MSTQAGDQKGRTPAPRSGLLVGLPKPYFWMMIAAGLTIGAVSGLSNTSVSNTLLELIIGFATGSAGIYFINRETLRKEGHALSLIGVLGIGFFLAFWIGYLPTTLYRYPGQSYYPWNDKLSVSDNLMFAELYGHARALGIPDASLTKALRAEAKAGDVQSCALLIEDPREISALIAEVHLAFTPLANPTDATIGATTYLEKRFKNLLDDLKETDPAKKGKATQSFESAISTFLALSRDLRDIANPSAKMCDPQNPKSANFCPLAIKLEQKMRGCADPAGVTHQLLAARVHARAYSEFWKQPVSTSPAKVRATLEAAD